MVERLNKAVLVVSAPDISSSDGIFELQKSLQVVFDGARRYAVGGVGELSREAVEILSDQFDVSVPYIQNSKRRSGYYIDAGEGDYIVEITATLSKSPVDGSYLQMGDDPDETVLTATSATGADPRTQGEMLHEWLSQSKLDSVNPAELHVGHHHDGTYSAGGDPGVFAEPLPVTVSELPRVNETPDESSSVEATFTCKVVSDAEAAVDAAEREIRGNS